MVGGVEDRVESLKEALAIDEVESRSARATNVGNNQVNVAGNTTEGGVKATRPDLSIGGQIK